MPARRVDVKEQPVAKSVPEVSEAETPVLPSTYFGNDASQFAVLLVPLSQMGLHLVTWVLPAWVWVKMHDGDDSL